MNDDSVSTSITQKLQTIASKLKVSVQKLRADLLLERLAYRLSNSNEIGSKLVFKGGIVSRKVYLTDRFTKDIDVATTLPRSDETLDKMVRAAKADCADGCWYELREIVSLRQQVPEGGARLSLSAGFGKTPESLPETSTLHIDVAYTETPFSHWESTQSLFGHPSLHWNVCEREVTAADKLHVLITRANDNTRAKDVYDLSRLLPDCDPSKLKEALSITFKLSGTSLPSDLGAAIGETDTIMLAKTWRKLREDITEDLSFEMAWGQVLEQLASLSPALGLANAKGPLLDSALRRASIMKKVEASLGVKKRFR